MVLKVKVYIKDVREFKQKTSKNNPKKAQIEIFWSQTTFPTVFEVSLSIFQWNIDLKKLKEVILLR